MTFNIKHLHLSEEYEFNVVVKGDGNNSFAGRLALTPSNCTITIMGEETDNRKCSIIIQRDIDQLICSTVRQRFILRDLKMSHGQGQSVRFNTKRIGFFEYTFDIGYVLFLLTDSVHSISFHSLIIHSESISKWVGNTEIQEDIIRAHNQNEPILRQPERLYEFEQQINELGVLEVFYNLSMHHSSPDFKSGIVFPPTLGMNYIENLSAREVKSEYEKIYNLMAFLIGGDFLVDKVDIGYSSFSHNLTGSLYFSSEKLSPVFEGRYTFFPLGKNLRFDSLSLPPFPLESFNCYFSLPDADKEFWNKYLKYKRMSNPEEKFLGYFRLLEKLCYKQKAYLDETILSELLVGVKPYLIKKFGDKKNVGSFLRGLPRYNRSKYNTEKCIQDFFKQIPIEVAGDWIFSNKNIGAVCKLRNDISHANDVVVPEDVIRENEKFVQILLVLAMCCKLDINISASSKLIDRISGYHLIVQRKTGQYL